MSSRYILAGGGSMLVFVSATAILIAFMQPPLRPLDYFIAGAVGTLFALAALFLTFVRVSKLRDVFYKKRPAVRGSESG